MTCNNHTNPHRNNDVNTDAALAVLEAAVAHLATCAWCRLDLSCVDGAALGEAAAWLWHAHHHSESGGGAG
jgi:hypothetical protein